MQLLGGQDLPDSCTAVNTDLAFGGSMPLKSCLCTNAMAVACLADAGVFSHGCLRIAGERRRGRPRKDAQLHDSSGDQQPALAVREVPPEVVSQRKASNPRENPTDNTDLSYD